MQVSTLLYTLAVAQTAGGADEDEVSCKELLGLKLVTAGVLEGQMHINDVPCTLCWQVPL